MQDTRIRDPRIELPYILKTEDVANLLDVCRKTAIKEIDAAERKGVLVLRIGKGKSPRVNRDSFCDYLESKSRKAI